MKIYVETSAISYLTAAPSRDLIVAARQEITREWWDWAIDHDALFASRLVRQEAAAGDPEAAKARLEKLNVVTHLEITPLATRVARQLLENRVVPETVPEDALHIGIAAAHEMDTLVTWNFKHLVNPSIFHRIDDTLIACGCQALVICTPDVLWERIDEKD